MLQWTRDLGSDVQQGLRLMRRSPVFTATAVIVLSLGIGVNTALFSVINALFFTPLPVKSPDELFYIYTKNEAGQVMSIVDTDFFQEFHARAEALADFTGHGSVDPRLTADGLTELANGEWIHTNYFSLLGVEMQLGRSLEPRDADLSVPGLAVVISDKFWKTRFGGRPDIVGTPVRLNASAGTIVGVAAEGFEGLSSPWRPSMFWVSGLKMQAELFGRRPATTRFIGGPIGRLKPGVSFEQFESFFAEVVPEWKATRIERLRLPTGRTLADLERWRRSIQATTYRCIALPTSVCRLIPKGASSRSGYWWAW